MVTILDVMAGHMCSFWNIVQMKWQILKFIDHFLFVIWYSFQKTILNAAI